jgi:hypothetical protein
VLAHRIYRFGSPTTARLLVGTDDRLAFGIALDLATRWTWARRLNLPNRLADHSQGFGGRVDLLAFGIALDLATS